VRNAAQKPDRRARTRREPASGSRCYWASAGSNARAGWSYVALLAAAAGVLGCELGEGVTASQRTLPGRCRAGGPVTIACHAMPSVDVRLRDRSQTSIMDINGLGTSS
jgi:hypothetical protein